MKKYLYVSCILLSLCLLAGCTVSDSAGDCTVETPAVSAEGETFRVIQEREGSLLLAKDDGERWDVFTVSLSDVPLTLDGEAFDPGDPGAYQALPGQHLEGASVEIVYGFVQETFPGHLVEVSSINILTEGFDDRCALYLQVLEDLWETDPGLNGDVSTVSVDLSQTGLTVGEQEAVAMAFSWDHGFSDYLTLSFAELKEQGYLDCADGNCDGIPHWEDGALLRITEKSESGTRYTDVGLCGLPTAANQSGSSSVLPAADIGADTLIFDAEKWRSALGAYLFIDCTSERDGGGHWDGYTVEAQAIS